MTKKITFDDGSVLELSEKKYEEIINQAQKEERLRNWKLMHEYLENLELTSEQLEKVGTFTLKFDKEAKKEQKHDYSKWIRRNGRTIAIEYEDTCLSDCVHDKYIKFEDVAEAVREWKTRVRERGSEWEAMDCYDDLTDWFDEIFGDFDETKLTAFEKDWDSESDKVWNEEEKKMTEKRPLQEEDLRDYRYMKYSVDEEELKGAVEWLLKQEKFWRNMSDGKFGVNEKDIKKAFAPLFKEDKG